MATLETNGNGEGNTNSSPSDAKTKRCVPSKYWCFTYFYKETDNLETLETILNKIAKKWIFGFEECPSTGKKHLQGYLEFKFKSRPLETKLLQDYKMHWEKRRGTADKNIEYCSKDGNFKTNIVFPEPLECIEHEQLYDWQKKIVSICDSKPDPRKIYWYCDEIGNNGKSELCRYLCIKKGAILLSGKCADMKYGIVKYIEKNRGIAPKIILIDLPRTFDKDYLSYSGIEEIKNGMFFNTKFESNMVIFNRPHIFIFSNTNPSNDKLSLDRWEIINI